MLWVLVRAGYVVLVLAVLTVAMVGGSLLAARASLLVGQSWPLFTWIVLLGAAVYGGFMWAAIAANLNERLRGPLRRGLFGLSTIAALGLLVTIVVVALCAPYLNRKRVPA